MDLEKCKNRIEELRGLQLMYSYMIKSSDLPSFATVLVYKLNKRAKKEIERLEDLMVNYELEGDDAQPLSSID